LQEFLLELGKGFAFVARQKRLSFEDTHLYVDPRGRWGWVCGCCSRSSDPSASRGRPPGLPLSRLGPVSSRPGPTRLQKRAPPPLAG
jgi:hypothetical protein